jgi:hypothetical protein
MTDKPEPKDANAKEPRPIIHLGKIGDGMEEKNLGERGEPAKRIKQDEVDAAAAWRRRRRPTSWLRSSPSGSSSA